MGREGKEGGREEREKWEGDSFGPRSGPPPLLFWRIYAHGRADVTMLLMVVVAGCYRTTLISSWCSSS